MIWQGYQNESMSAMINVSSFALIQYEPVYEEKGTECIYKKQRHTTGCTLLVHFRHEP